MTTRNLLGKTKRAIAGWLQQLVRRRQERALWRAATELILLGREMGEAQKDVDDAKDSIYRAMSAMKRETSNIKADSRDRESA